MATEQKQMKRIDLLTFCKSGDEVTKHTRKHAPGSRHPDHKYYADLQRVVFLFNDPMEEQLGKFRYWE
jgi:hypothetical protein